MPKDPIGGRQQRIVQHIDDRHVERSTDHDALVGFQPGRIEHDSIRLVDEIVAQAQLELRHDRGTEGQRIDQTHRKRASETGIETQLAGLLGKFIEEIAREGESDEGLHLDEGMKMLMRATALRTMSRVSSGS